MTDMRSAESELKEWLDTHGFPVPQPTTVCISPSLFNFARVRALSDLMVSVTN